MYGAVVLGILVVQAALSAVACHFIAAARSGVSPRRWTALGCLIGPAAIIATWWLAGAESRSSGRDMMRRMRVGK